MSVISLPRFSQDCMIVVKGSLAPQPSQNWPSSHRRGDLACRSGSCLSCSPACSLGAPMCCLCELCLPCRAISTGMLCWPLQGGCSASDTGLGSHKCLRRPSITQHDQETSVQEYRLCVSVREYARGEQHCKASLSFAALRNPV